MSHYLFCLTGSVLPLLSYCMRLPPLFCYSLAYHEHVTKSFWQTGHSLCTSQTKVSCNWTGPSSLVQNTWVSVQQETVQSKITKKAHHSLVKSFLDIFVLLLWYLKSYSLSHIFIHISLNYLQL